MTIALIRGIGDVGSAVALTLLKAGHCVVLIDAPQPAYCRRAASFTDAAYDGAKTLGGVVGRVCANPKDLPLFFTREACVPIVLSERVPQNVSAWAEVLVDARMRKKVIPENQRGIARLAIGIGPNFEAGKNADIVIESEWGAQLGHVIERGACRPFTGKPRKIEGFGEERYVYAPSEGLFVTAYTIGAKVRLGESIGDVDGSPVVALIDGWIRGVTRSGIKVRAGTKLADIDPSSTPSDPSAIGERPARIAQSVALAIEGTLDTSYAR